jgi:formate hydrogenlyase subunit 3/multisubunit Na+/H+ antiporter MnhD subunit
LASAIIIQGLHEFFLIEGQIPNLIVLVLGSGFLCLFLMAVLFRQFNRKNNTLKKAQTGDKD